MRHSAVSRRNLLKSAGGLILASALPFRHSTAAEAISPVMARLSAYMSEARNRALPVPVLEKTKHHVLDTIAAMVSGAELPPGRAAIAFARGYGGKAVATVAASSIVCGPIEAALANGVLAHADETDDSHGPSRSHPGCATVPAALALGEQFGASGMHFLRAVALGYDVGTRVTMSMGGPSYQTLTHRSTHGTAQIFSAAAAAGCAASLGERQMRYLLDYTAQQSSGIGAWGRDTDHMEKAFVFGGKSAAGGVTAALLVSGGWTGVDDIFSGADNFFEAFAPREDGVMKADPAGMVDALGERYEIMRTNIKKWAVGSPIQAPLDALELFFKRRSFSADEVQKVVVRMASDEARTVNNREIPDICLQHMVAVMLLDKTASFAAAHDTARMNDPAVLRQRAKVELLADPRIDAVRPRREGIVELTLADGTQMSEWIKDVRGTAENPMPRAEVAAKARDLMAPRLGKAKSAKLIDTVLALESVKNVRQLRPLLQRAG
jgi:2-methylcitrate dehydratase PrpD